MVTLIESQMRGGVWTVSAPGTRRTSPATGPLSQWSRFGERMRACGMWEPTRSTIVRLEKNDVLYTCGQVDDNLYLIRFGRIKTSTVSRCGKGCLVDIYSKDDLLGESCLTLPERAEAATAMTTTLVAKIPRANFLDRLAEEDLLEDCLGYLSSRLVERQQMITHLVTTDSERRLAATLLWLGSKLGVRQGTMLFIEQRITQAELAEMVGTTRSRVGYFLKNFRSSGLVSTQTGCPMTLHVDRLQSYLNSFA